jgi:hypothetical protein
MSANGRRVAMSVSTPVARLRITRWRELCASRAVAYSARPPLTSSTRMPPYATRSRLGLLKAYTGTDCWIDCPDALVPTMMRATSRVALAGSAKAASEALVASEVVPLAMTVVPTFAWSVAQSPHVASMGMSGFPVMLGMGRTTASCVGACA